MEGYRTREAADVLDLSPRRVRRFVNAGVVTPARDPRGGWSFSFRDLILLRVAAGLLASGIPVRRVVRSMEDVRRALPADRSLTELRIVADGTRILVLDGDSRWEADTGQFVLDFRVEELAARVAPLRPEIDRFEDAETLYALGTELEDRSAALAREAYEKAISLDPGHADALVNLGRLLHEDGRPDEAARLYRRALDSCPDHATAAFNLGVALEDQARWGEAARAYHRAVELEPGLADAHYNLATVLERLGDRQAALRSLRRYRELTHRPVAG
jgi:tetratricopeptide (TPR) repeat protein